MTEKIKALTKKQLETLKNKLLEEKESLVFNEVKTEGLDLALINGGDDVEQSISDYNNSHQLRFRKDRKSVV